MTGEIVTHPNDSWRDLEQIQRWMQAAIMHPVGVAQGIASAEARRHIDVGPDGAESVVTRSKALTALERLAIYGYAYYARLLECLGDEFPVLKHALGEELFDAFAAEYLEQYPSRSYTLFHLGLNFPRFLAETRPNQEGDRSSAADDVAAAEFPRAVARSPDPATTGSQSQETPAERTSVDWPDFLIDLATLELTFNEVFDGPGVEGEELLDAGYLRAIAPERLLEARLVGVPCLRLLALHYPVHKYFTAVRRLENPPMPEPAETCLAVTRRRYVVRHYELSRPAYQLLQALLAGESVGQAINRAVEAAGPNLDQLPDSLRTWFHDWAAEGFFRSVELAD
jgi:Putative DNA-binding domain/NGO1945 C-terminal domain